MPVHTEEKLYAFLVHPPELRDVARKFPCARFIPAFILRAILKLLPPLVGSTIHGFRLQTGEEAEGRIVICPLTAQQMLDFPDLAQKRVLESVRLAQRLGCGVIGLGAFTSIVTNGGLDLAGKVSIGLTSGNAYAAALAIENLTLATGKLGKDLKDCSVAVVGAAGSVGSACAKILAPKVKKIILVDKRQEELGALARDLGRNDITLHSELPAPVPADAVITVTSSAKGIIRSEHLLPATIVIDCAQPHNVAEETLRDRHDLIVIHSGIAHIPGLDLGMDVGLKKEEVFACLGEALILTWRGWKGNYSLGQVNPVHVQEILEYAPKVGLRVADFRNAQGPIPEAAFERIKHNAYEGAIHGVSDL